MNDRLGLTGVALRIFFRSPLNYVPLVLLFSLLSFLLAATILFKKGVENAAVTSAARLGADLMIIPEGEELPLGKGLYGGFPVRFSLPDGIERVVTSLPGVVRAAPQYFLSSALSDCCEKGNLLLVGFDPKRDFTVLPWLRDGGSATLGPEKILVGAGVMKARGASMKLFSRRFEVAGRLDRSGLGYFDNAAFVPLAGVAEMERSSRNSGVTPLTVPWGRPSIVLLQLAPAVSVSEAARSLERQLRGVRVLIIADQHREDKLRLFMVAGAPRSLLITAWVLSLVAGGAAQMLYWHNRRATLGLLQAFGRGKVPIALLFSLEAFLASLAGMVAGSMAAFLTIILGTPLITAVVGVPLVIATGTLFSSVLPLLWIGFAVAMALEVLLITLWMMRQEPYDLLRVRS